jgi:catechol 2,3-dioxygenase
MSMTTEGLSPPESVSIHPDTRMGAVRLTVSDLERSRGFYEQVLGFRVFEQEDGTLAFGPDSQHLLVELTGNSSAPRLDRRATGLFHLAILLPSRPDLAAALARVARARWPLDGASDHLVSEALYLSDPDGNGIEIYRDRPREEWSYSPDHQLQMSTLPLDLRDVMGELGNDASLSPMAPAGTTIGHVHLQVGELVRTEAFYSDILGFDVVVRGYPGALFVSAGGYHHHLGLNTWNSAGGSPPPPGAVGLRSYDLVLPNESEVDAVLANVRAAGINTEPVPNGVELHDPSGNALVLTAA